MTRVSVTIEGATVVVEVLVDDVEGEAVVDGGVDVVVVAGGVVEVVGANVAIGVAVGALVVDDDASDPEEHDSISLGRDDQARTTTLVWSSVTGVSTRGDENAAIPVRELLALHESADLGEELGDVAHHAVLGSDLGGDTFELGSGHQYRCRVDG